VGFAAYKAQKRKNINPIKPTLIDKKGNINVIYVSIIHKKGSQKYVITDSGAGLFVCFWAVLAREND